MRRIALDRSGRRRTRLAPALGGTAALGVVLALAACGGPTNGGASPSSAAAPSESFGHAGAIAVGDLDGDGNLDVAIRHHAAREILIFYGDGLGGFSESRGPYLVPGAGMAGAALGDVDGDGDLDIITAVDDVGSSNTGIHVLRNEGGRRFAEPEPVYAPDDRIDAFASVDVDRDGDLDLVVAESGSGVVSVVVNDGHGRFAVGARHLIDGRPTRVILADLDADGEFDLAVTSVTQDRSKRLHVLQGEGRWSYEAPLEATFPPYVPRAILGGDVDGDGDVDLVVPHFLQDDLLLVINEGGGRWRAARAGVETTDGVKAAALGDVDVDGDLDLAVSASHGVAIYLNRGDGRFRRSASFPAVLSPEELALADLDGDGDPDLVESVGPYNVGVYINERGGRFTSSRTF